MKKVIVIGGGWAGLSAAVECAKNNYSVTLLEQSGRLGGRASSFADQALGEIVDNGQHLFMSCYDFTTHFLQEIGSLKQIQFQKNLSINFVDENGREDSFSCFTLPAPLHLASGLFRRKTFSFKEKCSFIRVYKEVRFGSKKKQEKLSVHEWLDRCGQSQNSRKWLWDPLTYATLNENPKRANASDLITVLRDGFFRSAKKSRLGISSVGLSELCDVPCENFLRARNGTVERNRLVAQLEIKDERVKNVILRDGKKLQADFVISAVPHFVLKNLLAEAVINNSFFRPIQKLENSPILSIVLHFDREFLNKNFIGIVGTQVQWIFNQSAIHDYQKKAVYSIIISAGHHLLTDSDEAIVKICLKELRSAFPDSQKANLLYSKVIREKNATLSPSVGYEKNRLPFQTPIKNFFLCGDWTRTGLPATIESAVLSGVKAAALLNVA